MALRTSDARAVLPDLRQLDIIHGVGSMRVFRPLSAVDTGPGPCYVGHMESERGDSRLA